MRESAFKKEALVFLSQRGALVRNNPIGLFYPIYNPTRPIRIGVAGEADLLACLPGGGFAAIETKSTKGKQRDAQKRYEAAVLQRSGIYLVARTLEDLEPLFETRPVF